ncbi:hypothetical protein S7711_06990 [Stachybotrys chartarum IBT 7711]|uniref:Ureidoglycolate hydrolase n=1 Tax=Stachybotrys chartarum (strain CBS 109288 / IBT 7711) TaxID=1280523 RepID=A0A084AYA8_STACB|nr:hypothetical protein S7711_06990 [Stachybotrys chartarum IBT 7711]KFA47586.1 hypothetical protein S40293_07406 [Stachybotrys chartarum IBT 40293]
MTIRIQIGDTDVQVTAVPLTQEAFAPFGDVVSNPRPDVHPSSFDVHASTLPPNAFSANQGFAVQYRSMSRIRNLYGQSPSGTSEPAMSVFCTAARQLTSPGAGRPHQFTVRFLERHPFTTQTFSPVDSSASSYLVIVAPSLPPSGADEGLPVPQGTDVPGRGLPDLGGLKAFLATKSQAVTYGAGTWHAPMVTLGPPGTTLNFVVSQFMSGVADEDCQLVEFESSGVAEPRIKVLLPPRTGRLEKL